jgi:hypothetical protein
MKTSIRVYVLLFSCISSHTGLRYSHFSLLGVKRVYFRSVLVGLCCYVVFTGFVLFLLCCHCGLIFFFALILYFIFEALVYSDCCFCSYCCLMLRGLAYAVVCFLTSMPPLLDTVDMKSRFETCHYVEKSISLI